LVAFKFENFMILSEISLLGIYKFLPLLQ